MHDDVANGGAGAIRTAFFALLIDNNNNNITSGRLYGCQMKKSGLR